MVNGLTLNHKMTNESCYSYIENSTDIGSLKNYKIQGAHTHFPIVYRSKNQLLCAQTTLKKVILSGHQTSKP